MAAPAHQRAGARRGVSITVRAEPSHCDLIDRAAQALGKSRSEFMLEAACKEAQAVLLDRRFFTLDEAQFQAFMARLDARAPPENLVALLNRRAPWE
jgi:uncharacterized protein (DUF1778 family)